jgi:hypothetical protein
MYNKESTYGKNVFSVSDIFRLDKVDCFVREAEGKSGHYAYICLRAYTKILSKIISGCNMFSTCAALLRTLSLCSHSAEKPGFFSKILKRRLQPETAIWRLQSAVSSRRRLFRDFKAPSPTGDGHLEISGRCLQSETIIWRLQDAVSSRRRLFGDFRMMSPAGDGFLEILIRRLQSETAIWRLRDAVSNRRFRIKNFFR